MQNRSPSMDVHTPVAAPAAAVDTDATSLLPTKVTIDDEQYTILRLGTPLFGKTATKNVLLSRGFVVDDLTLVGQPKEVSDDDQDAFTFTWIVYLTQQAQQKPLSNDLLQEVIKFTTDTDRLPVVPPGNRTLLNMPDGRTVRVPVVPEMVTAKRKAAPKKQAVGVEAFQHVFETFAKTGACVLAPDFLKAFNGANKTNKTAFNAAFVESKEFASVDVKRRLLRQDTSAQPDGDDEEDLPEDVLDDDDDDDEEDVPRRGRKRARDETSRAALVYTHMSALIKLEELDDDGKHKMQRIAKFALGDCDTV